MAYMLSFTRSKLKSRTGRCIHDSVGTVYDLITDKLLLLLRVANSACQGRTGSRQVVHPTSFEVRWLYHAMTDIPNCAKCCKAAINCLTWLSNGKRSCDPFLCNIFRLVIHSHCTDSQNLPISLSVSTALYHRSADAVVKASILWLFIYWYTPKQMRS